MAARKNTAKPKPQPEPTSVTGAQLIDGQPYFATIDGVAMNRRQWLDATRPNRKAALVAALRDEADTLTIEAQQGNVAQ